MSQESLPYQNEGQQTGPGPDSQYLDGSGEAIRDRRQELLTLTMTLPSAHGTADIELDCRKHGVSENTDMKRGITPRQALQNAHQRRR